MQVGVPLQVTSKSSDQVHAAFMERSHLLSEFRRTRPARAPGLRAVVQGVQELQNIVGGIVSTYFALACVKENIVFENLCGPRCVVILEGESLLHPFVFRLALSRMLLAKFVAFEGARWHSPVFVFPKTKMNGSQ